MSAHYTRLAANQASNKGGIWTTQPALPPTDWLATATMMVENAKRAAARSGDTITSIAKTKTFGFLESELYGEIARLLAEQDRRCAYTGIALKRKGEEPTDQCASLDRIDSAKGYEPENLQIVCRFINELKSATPDGDFRRRLAWIREAPSAQHAINIDADDVDTEDG